MKYDGFVIDNLVAIGAAVLLWIPAVSKRKLGKGAGAVMLLGYAGYFVYLLLNATA